MASRNETKPSYSEVISDAIPACQLTQTMLDKWERAKARLCAKVASAGFVTQLRFHGMCGNDLVFSSPTHFQAGWLQSTQYNYRELLGETARWMGAYGFRVLVDSRMNETLEERKSWKPMLSAPAFIEQQEQPVF